MISGKITRDYTICCSQCGHWEQLETKNKELAAKRWKRIGWAHIAHVGWACPKCVDTLKEGGSET